MSETKKVQAEDNPVADETKKQPEVKAVIPAPKKGFFARILPWVIVALVFLLAGFVVTWFTLYQPKVAELQYTQTQVAAAGENASQLQQQIDDKTVALNKSQEDLTHAQATIVAQSTAIAHSDLLQLIYKFQSDVNLARTHLLQQDPASSKQAFAFITADLSELEKAGLDETALSGFKAKIEDAQNYMESEPAKSLDAMETIYANLLLLISNLK